MKTEAEKAIEEAYKKGKEEGQRQEHLRFCGWCRQQMKCPYK